MATLAASSFNASIRHQVFIERLKSGEVRKIIPFLREIDRSIRLRLSGEELTGFARGRLDALLVEVEALIDGVLNRYTAGLQRDLLAFAVSESQFEARSLTHAVSNTAFEAVIPAPNQIQAAVFSAPLSVRGPGGGKLLTPLLKGFTAAQKDSIPGVIRQGVFEGQTNAQITRRIRGTKAAKYADGILAVSQRQGEAIVRTAVQHVSSVARSLTYEENSDLVTRYEWVSTLDSATCEVCASLSGEVFKVGEGPMPGIHLQCRCTTVPLLDEKWDFLKEGATQSAEFGPVDADQTYFDWMKDQSAQFQDAALGPTRGALLRDGGLSAKRFSQFVASKNYEPLTLAEMQDLEPLAFKRAGITINPDTGRVINAL